MKRKSDIWLRSVADLLIVNASVFVGLLASYPILYQNNRSTLLPIHLFLGKFAFSFVLMSIIALPIFHLFGFYTRSRAYRGRYKALVVLQAVTLCHIVFGFFGWLFPSLELMPKTSLVGSFAVMTVLSIGARLWAGIWAYYNKVAENERVPLPEKTDRPSDIAVIGGAGYIGSGLLRKLLEKGYRVRLVDSFMFGEEPIADLIGHKNLEIIRADFRQIDKIVEAMRGMDAVVHLGAIVGDPACALDEDFTIEVNLMATRLIAECAKGFGIRKFVFASTCSVYGASDDLLNERSHLKPVSLYARSKIACEKLLLQLSDDWFQPTILRFGTVYGLSGRTRFDLVVNLLTAKAVVERKITVFGEDQWRPFVHVDDASLAVLKALEARIDVVGGEIFNVGADEGNMTLGDVGRMIKRMVPEAELIMSGSDGDRRNYRVDFSKIRNRLKFEPQWTVQKGIQQVLDAFDSGKISDYTAPEYSNVKYLSEEANTRGLVTDIQRLRAMVEETAYEPSTASSTAPSTASVP